jgi:tripartite-type tricarboxylate transporter receptor subunit TctC
MQLAEAVGIDPKMVNYLTDDGGGELLPALLGNKVAFSASGLRRVPRPGPSGSASGACGEH